VRAKRRRPPDFSKQAHAGDLDVVGQRFAHVVDRQCRHRSSRQRLHFHSGAVMTATRQRTAICARPTGAISI